MPQIIREPSQSKEIDLSVSAKSKPLMNQRSSIVSASPPQFHVPRLKHMASTDEIVQCWRLEYLRNRKFTPQRLLQTSDQRSRLWGGYTNGWWSLSGNKCAFKRIRAIVRAVVDCSAGKCDIDYLGDDDDWQKAILSYDTKKSSEVPANPSGHQSDAERYQFSVVLFTNHVVRLDTPIHWTCEHSILWSILPEKYFGSRTSGAMSQLIFIHLWMSFWIGSFLSYECQNSEFVQRIILIIPRRRNY